MYQIEKNKPSGISPELRNKLDVRNKLYLLSNLRRRGFVELLKNTYGKEKEYLLTLKDFSDVQLRNEVLRLRDSIGLISFPPKL